MKTSIIFTILVLFLVSCDMRMSNERTVPIRVYPFDKSKFQVEDNLLTLVDSNNTFRYIGEPDIWNGFQLEILTDNDSIKYSFYYPYSPLDWLMDSDSTFLILVQVSRKRDLGVTYFYEFDESEKEEYTKIFTESIFEPLTDLLKVQESYRIYDITDSTDRTTHSHKFVLCKTQTTLDCDTLDVIYGDNSRYEISTSPGAH